MISFNDLLKPYSLNDFLADFWERRPVCLPCEADGATRFSDFPNLEQLPQLLAGNYIAGQWNGGPSHASASILDKNGVACGLGQVPRGMFEQLYNAGVSLCLGPMNYYNKNLKAFVDSVKKGTCITGDIGMTCYVTPPGSGSPMHFDCQNVFFCQVSGTKHWKYSVLPATEYPPVNLVPKFPDFRPTMAALNEVGINVAPPEECEFTEVTLHPGDVLYLPPGVWHEPRTSDDHSLHYTLTFVPFGFLHLLIPWMRLLMLKNPEWRKELRFLDTHADTGKLTTFLRSRIEELQASVRELDSNVLLAQCQNSSINSFTNSLR